MLGNWQAGRADAKRATAAGLERITVRGTFAPQFTVLLDNKVRRGQVGYEVVTPLKLLDSPGYVLVSRGWVRAGPSREQLPEVRTPQGEVRIGGIALERLPRVLQAGPESRTRVRQNLDVKGFAEETGLLLEPWVIQQHSDAGDGLLREWLRAEAGVEKHDMYALQWYSLAALAIALVTVLSFRKADASSK